jgi:hypothetical protein
VIEQQLMRVTVAGKAVEEADGVPERTLEGVAGIFIVLEKGEREGQVAVTTWLLGSSDLAAAMAAAARDAADGLDRMASEAVMLRFLARALGSKFSLN